MRYRNRRVSDCSTRLTSLIEVKVDLRRRAKQLHIVKQKRLVNQAVANLLRIQKEEYQHRLPFSGSSAITSGKIPERGIPVPR